MFQALLKHWRGSRGMSQLDLASAAGVSARHISFLETGRSAPSQEMVLRLANTLAVPLREQNALLTAAGFPEHYPNRDVADALAGPVGDAVDRMMSHQEPYPLIVMDRGYGLLRANRAATRVLSHFVAEPAVLEPPVNALGLLFDPRGVRPFVQDWKDFARTLLSRVQRERLVRPGDELLTNLLSSICAHPGVPTEWRDHDFGLPNDPVLSLRVERGDMKLAFMTTVTVFNAPQAVDLEEIKLEAYFPLDEATQQACEKMAG